MRQNHYFAKWALLSMLALMGFSACSDDEVKSVYQPIEFTFEGDFVSISKHLTTTFYIYIPNKGGTYTFETVGKHAAVGSLTHLSLPNKKWIDKEEMEGIIARGLPQTIIDEPSSLVGDTICAEATIESVAPYRISFYFPPNIDRMENKTQVSVGDEFIHTDLVICQEGRKGN